MPVRRKQVKKSIEPVEKARLRKQIQLVAKEVKRLDSRIQDLNKLVNRGHFRLL